MAKQLKRKDEIKQGKKQVIYLEIFSSWALYPREQDGKSVSEVGTSSGN